MIKIFFKNAIRHLYRNKLFSVVNLLGLLVGFIASFYLASYIHHECSFDNYHPDRSNTYRVLSLQGNGEEISNLSAINFLPIAGFIGQDIPEVDQVVRLKMNQVVNLRIGEEFFTEKDFAWADETVFDVFHMPFIHGSAQSALADPKSIVLTESKAVQYFGNKNPVGEVIILDTLLMNVTGVIADAPDNTHINPSMIGSMSTHLNLDDPWAPRVYLLNASCAILPQRSGN
jgi:putative ABC transport system permease protein